ncbi:hypothetical protein [Clostridium septicum]|uniref:hypothetical protein n=1 Tax=Clostridium septicum TaxID=1504 RepID=UPI000FF8D4A1|nr:hypothetical protein [Clostridium septicum]QAS60537.1 hypothetical protein EI377_07175 [Clostridium septicum]
MGEVYSIEQQIKEAEANINSLNIEKAKLDIQYNIEGEKLEVAASLYENVKLYLRYMTVVL